MPGIQDIAKVGGKGGNSNKYAIALIGSAFMIITFSSIGFASYALNRNMSTPEVVPGTSLQAGAITCADWGAPKSPEDYQALITKAANLAGIQPALLGAILLDEQGGSHTDDTTISWYKLEAHTPGSQWAQGGAAQGPFQIEDWDGKWNGSVVTPKLDPILLQALTSSGSVYTDGQYKGRAKGDPNNFYESALVAAGYLKSIVNDKNIKFNPATTDKNEIRCIGAGYNGGAGMCANWKNANYAGAPNTTKRYEDRTWNGFQGLSTGCSSFTGGTAASNTTAGAPALNADTTVMNQSAMKSWASKQPDLKPSGIVISDSGSPANYKNEAYDHLFIDKKGKVYQWVPFNKQSSEGDLPGKDFVITISYQSTDAPGTAGNPKVMDDAIVSTIRSLRTTFPAILNEKGTRQRFQAKRGIFGFQQAKYFDDNKDYPLSIQQEDNEYKTLQYVWSQLGSQ